jgi:hypothetical protein
MPLCPAHSSSAAPLASLKAQVQQKKYSSGCGAPGRRVHASAGTQGRRADNDSGGVAATGANARRDARLRPRALAAARWRRPRARRTPSPARVCGGRGEGSAARQRAGQKATTGGAPTGRACASCAAAHPRGGHGREDVRVVGVHVVPGNAVYRLAVVLLRGNNTKRRTSRLQCVAPTTVRTRRRRSCCRPAREPSGGGAPRRACTVHLCTKPLRLSPASCALGQRGICGGGGQPAPLPRTAAAARAAARGSAPAAQRPRQPAAACARTQDRRRLRTGCLDAKARRSAGSEMAARAKTACCAGC